MDIHNKYHTQYKPVLIRPNGELVKPGDEFAYYANVHGDVMRYISVRYVGPVGEFGIFPGYYQNRFYFKGTEYPYNGRYSLTADELGLRFARIPYRRHSPWRSSALTHGTNPHKKRHC